MNCADPASVDILPNGGNITVGTTAAASDITDVNATLQKLNTNHPVEVEGCVAGCANITTYWNITVPVGVSGTCTGTAVFNAVENS
jgi:hypothetical protein